MGQCLSLAGNDGRPSSYQNAPAGRGGAPVAWNALVVGAASTAQSEAGAAGGASSGESSCGTSSHDCDVTISTQHGSPKQPLGLLKRRRAPRRAVSEGALAPWRRAHDPALARCHSEHVPCGAADGCLGALLAGGAWDEPAGAAGHVAALCCRALQVAAVVVMPVAAAAGAGAGPPFLACSSSGWKEDALAAGAAGRALRAAAARCAAEAAGAGSRGAGEGPPVLFAPSLKLAVAGRGSKRARFLAAAPLIAPDGSHRGSLALLDPRPRGVSPNEASLISHIAALLARDMPAQPFSGGSSGGAGDRGGGRAGAAAAALERAPGPAAERRAARAAAAPDRRFSGAALVDASRGFSVMCADGLFGKMTGVPPSAAAEAGAGAGGVGLWRLLGADSELQAAAAAAARARRAFDASVCVRRHGAAMQLRLTLECAYPASSGAGAAGGAEEGGGGSGLLPYLVTVDFLGASDAEMWTAAGEPRRFRLLPEP